MGPYASQVNKDKETDVDKNNRFDVCASSMQGWRNSQEDAHVLELNLEGKDIHLFCVFDGHGGHEVAQYVGKNFSTLLLKNENYKKENYGEALKEVFFQFDDLMRTPEIKEILYYLNKKEKKEDVMYDQANKFNSTAGCTANVALIVGNRLIVANAGDSRSVLSIQKEVEEMSFDHKPDDPIEKKRIQEADGFVSDGRVNGNLSLSRAIGDLEFKANETIAKEKQLISAEADIKEYSLSGKEEFLLMGCDGIWECETNQELIQRVNQSFGQSNDVKTSTENLMDALVAPNTQNHTYGLDNMTVIIIKFL